jgi:hypothetical protein
MWRTKRPSEIVNSDLPTLIVWLTSCLLDDFQRRLGKGAHRLLPSDWFGLISDKSVEPGEQFGLNADAYHLARLASALLSRRTITGS